VTQSSANVADPQTEVGVTSTEQDERWQRDRREGHLASPPFPEGSSS
jgi:hypothetical protein